MSSQTKSPKKAKQMSSKAKSGPKTIDLIVASIKALKERRGSSTASIKKYMAANFKFDVAKKNTFVNNALKRGVANKVLIQTKGTGAAGSFKVNTAKSDGAAARKLQREKKAARMKTKREKAKAKSTALKAKKAARKAAAKKKKAGKRKTKKHAKPKKAAKKPAAKKRPAKKAAKPKKARKPKKAARNKATTKK